MEITPNPNTRNHMIFINIKHYRILEYYIEYIITKVFENDMIEIRDGIDLNETGSTAV